MEPASTCTHARSASTTYTAPCASTATPDGLPNAPGSGPAWSTRPGILVRPCSPTAPTGPRWVRKSGSDDRPNRRHRRSLGHQRPRLAPQSPRPVGRCASTTVSRICQPGRAAGCDRCWYRPRTPARACRRPHRWANETARHRWCRRAADQEERRQARTAATEEQSRAHHRALHVRHHCPLDRHGPTPSALTRTSVTRPSA